MIILMHFLVTANITVTAKNNTDVAFENCVPFSTFETEINDVFFDGANHTYITMPIYNWLNIVIIILIQNLK